MRNKAQEIAIRVTNSTDAMTAAEQAGAEVDQDWEGEETRYTFDDGSILSVSGPHWTVSL